MKAKKLFAVLISAVTLLNLAGLICLYLRMDSMSDDSQTVSYTLYIGLNDKDTYTQEISDSEAMETVEGICAKYIDGCTFQNASGMWVDEGGSRTYENTIVCRIDGADEDVVHLISDELIEALNQSTILIEKNMTCVEYYSGN